MMSRLAFLAVLAASIPALAAPVPALAPPAGRGSAAAGSSFRTFLESLWPEAQAQGVSRATFDAAFAGLNGPDPAVAARRQGQSEFGRPIWEYLAGAVSSGRVGRGRALATRLEPVLAGIEGRYGVPRATILAVWGMESDFGAGTGTVPTIRALATLAFLDHRRGTFRAELVAALRILQEDHVAPERMMGSWAGAMGQVQFLPSSFLRYAVDGDGDGRRDIWTSPEDALASTANFLKGEGWRADLPWGFEVVLPQGFDLSRHRRTLAEFAALGARRVDGAPLPSTGEASLFLPAGRAGPAFLLTDNFEVVRAYNISDSYALAVGLLSDRLAGGGALAGRWPSGQPQLGRAGILEVQRRLTDLRLYADEPDGRLGKKTRDAVRRYQLAQDLPADGFADPALLAHLRRAGAP